jgi:hypothetical protein
LVRVPGLHPGGCRFESDRAYHFMKTRNTKSIGQQSEVMLLAALVSRGYSVCIPYGDNERYDFVVDYDGVFLRMQVKTGRVVDGVIVFNARSCGAKYNSGMHYRGQCELFGVYVPSMNKSYILPVDEVCTTAPSLRLIPPKNNHKKHIRWAKDYEI